MAISEGITHQRLKLRRQTDWQKEIFQCFMESSGQAFGMAALDGSILFVNTAMCRLLGAESPEELYKQNIRDWYDPETNSRLQEEILPNVMRERQWTGELVIKDRQGHSIPTIENIFLLSDNAGKPLFYASVITDISGLIRMKEELSTHRLHLEKLVANRTADLEKANGLLRARIAELEDAEVQRSRLAAILEATSDLVAIASPEGKVLYMNEAGRHMVGWQKENGGEEIEHYIADVHPGWALEVILNEGMPAANTTGVWQGESVILNGCGKEVPVSQVITAHRGGHGEIERYSTIMRDIGALKKAEDAIKQSEAKYSLLYKSMRDGFARVGLDGTFIEFNEAFAEMLGYSAREIAGLTYRDITPEKWHDVEKEILEKQILTRGYSDIYEKEYRRKDGTIFPVNLRTVLIRDDEGHPSGMWAIVRDISAQKQSESNLHENLSSLAEAERIGQIGSWKLDRTTRNFYCSRGMLKILGLHENEIITFDQFLSRIHPDDLERGSCKAQEAFGQRLSFMEEFRIIHTDGTIRHIIGRAEAEIDRDGVPVMIHGTAQDISERKRMEEDIIKAQKLESIETLAGGLAHDYNNLLATIMGSLDIIKSNMDETNRAYSTLEKAEQAALAASDLTKQLMTFSRGGYHTRRIMPVNKLLTETVRLALKGSFINAEWKIGGNLPKVNIDENQISQAIHNIVMNARDAMSQNGKIIIEADEVTLEPDNALQLTRGNYVRLIFRDEGPGIRADYIPKLFDPYFSTKAAGKKKGLGLGLAVCYSIMKRHNGHIQIDSIDGVGATVIIHIPAVWSKNYPQNVEG